MSTKVSIGWIAKWREYEQFGGHNSRCKVYATEKVARSNNRVTVLIDKEKPWSYDNTRPETDQEQDERLEFHEVFYEQG